MKNILYILIALIVIGGVYYYLQNKDEMSVTESTPTEDVSEEEDMDDMTDDEDVSADDPESSAAVIESEGSVSVDLDDEPSTAAKVFDLDGFNFGYSVSEIRVKEGDTVTINFTSTDGFHDWVVDEFDAATDRVQTGQTTSVTFVADAAGTYEFYCSVGQHRANGMVGTLIVE